MVGSQYVLQHPVRWRLALWGGIAGLLLLPWVAMQFTDEMRWDAFDFAAAAVLLVGGGLAFEVAVRVTRRTSYRAAAGAALLFAVLLLWADGAVGVF